MVFLPSCLGSILYTSLKGHLLLEAACDSVRGEVNEHTQTKGSYVYTRVCVDGEKDQNCLFLQTM